MQILFSTSFQIAPM